MCTCVEARDWHPMSFSITLYFINWAESLTEPGTYWFQKSSYLTCLPQPRVWALGLQLGLCSRRALIWVGRIKIPVFIFTGFCLLVISPVPVFLGLLELTKTCLSIQTYSLNEKMESYTLPLMNEISPDPCFWLFSSREIVLLWSPK